MRFGRSRGGVQPPLFLDQTEVRGAEKTYFLRPPPPLSQGMDAPVMRTMCSHHITDTKVICTSRFFS